MTSQALFAAIILASVPAETVAPRIPTPEYLATDAPLTIGAPNGALCVAVNLLESSVHRKSLEVPGFDGVPTAPGRAARIPPKVMSGLTARFPQAKIDKWTKEKEEGKEVYDIEFKQGDRKFEVDIFADGTIHNWEQQVAASDLPQAVVQAVTRQFPNAAMKEIMAVTAVTNGNEWLEGYEIVVQRARKPDVEMTIAPDGKILEGPGKEK
jgi:hypothetical protein